VLNDKFRQVYQCKKCDELCKLGELSRHKCKAKEFAQQINNSAMDAIRKAYIEGYSMGHHHTVESCYCPEQAADDWLSEQHQ